MVAQRFALGECAGARDEACDSITTLPHRSRVKQHYPIDREGGEAEQLARGEAEDKLKT